MEPIKKYIVEPLSEMSVTTSGINCMYRNTNVLYIDKNNKILNCFIKKFKERSYLFVFYVEKRKFYLT